MSEINFCNTKEQLNHLGEVVTGKADGSPSGADIDTSTLTYTGQVRKTLPALEAEYEQSIANKEAEADSAIDSYRLLNKGDYSPGILLSNNFEFIEYNGESYFATNPPYTTTATTPDSDGNLFIGGYLTQQAAGGITNYQALNASEMIQNKTVGGSTVGSDLSHHWISGGTLFKRNAIAEALSSFVPKGAIVINDFLDTDELTSGIGIQGVINYAETLAVSGSGSGGATLVLLAGKYTLSGDIDLGRYSTIKGQGFLNTQINYTGSGKAFKFQKGEYAVGQGIEDVWIKGPNDTGSGGSSRGVEVSDTFGFKLRNVTISNFYEDLVLHNQTAWTEGTVLENVKLESSRFPLVFERTGGTSSYAYTRAINVAITPLKATGLVSRGISFGGGATAGQEINVYNSLLNINVWGGQDVTAVYFHDDAWVRDSQGLFAGEDDGGSNYQYVEYETTKESCGFERWTGEFRASPASELDMDLIAGDRIVNRQLFNNRNSGSPKWIKVCTLSSAVHSVSGKIVAQNDYGLGNQSSNINFHAAFSTRSSSGLRYVFSSDGNFQKSGNAATIMRIYENTSGEHEVYIQMASFSRYMMIENVVVTLDSDSPKYSYDAVSDPSGNSDLTLLWSSEDASIGTVQIPVVAGFHIQLNLVITDASEYTDASSAINALPRGYMTYSLGNTKPLYKSGSSTTSTWNDAAGVVVYTPT